MNWITRTWRQVKAAVAMRWSRSGGWGSLVLGSTAYDWAGAADGRANAAAVACVRWLQRTFPEAPTQVLVRKGKDLEPDPAHPLAQLLDRPNPAYSGLHLWAATVADLTYSGNGYWLKVRSGANRVVELWWVPSTMMEPRWPQDGSQFISHYDYTVNGRATQYDPSDVVHFRDGFDPANIRLGLSPLASLARELATDNEAANWTASLLRNSAIPGVVISPDADAKPTQEEADEIKSKFIQKFTGDHRGEPLVMRGKTKVTVLAFSPEQMNLRELRRIPEERISAVIGVPAVVVGLGSGLDRATYSNMAEAREAAYESLLIPLQRLLAAEINNQLGPDFGRPGQVVVGFDLSQVRVLQTDQNELHTRIRDDVRGGLLTVNEGRQALGLAALPGADVLYLPIAVTPTDPADLLATPEPAPAPLALPAPEKGWSHELRLGGTHAEQIRLAVIERSAARATEEQKAAEDVANSIERLRTRLGKRCASDMAKFLTAQASRIVDRLGTDGKAAGDTPTAADLVPASEAGELRKVLDPWYLRTLDGVHDLTEAALGIDFQLDDPVTRAFLADAGEQIVGIVDTTRDAVRAALIEGQAAGESLADLAKRLRGLPSFDKARAMLVARTELARSSNLSAIACYRASDVVLAIRVFDGDGDADCAAINGQTWTFAKAAANLLGHPNCRRAFAGITDAAELAA